MRAHGATFHLYADDTQIYLSFDLEDAHDIVKRMEKCISDIRSWMASNFLRLNDSKTELLMIGSKSHIKAANPITIHIGDADIMPSQSVRNIGAMFDQCMTMQNHIDQTCRGAWYHIRNIASIKRFLSHEALEKVVHAFVTSKLDNLNCLLYGVPDVHLKKLQRVQNSAARIVSGCNYTDNITPVLKTLHWLPIKLRINYKILTITWKCLNGEGPDYLREVLTPLNHSRSLRSNNAMQLVPPKTALITVGDRCFSAAAPKLWNTLPIHIKQATSIDIFKRSLKTHFFRLYFE